MMLSSNTASEMPWQFVVGVVVLTTVMVALNRRKRMRQHLNPKAVARQRVSERQKRDSTESDVRDLLLELEKAAREITAQIDTRYRKLEAGMRAADERIGELRRLAGGRTTAAPTLVTGGSGRLDVVIGDEGVVAAPSVSAAGAASTERNSDFERVCALADGRMSARDIAARVQRTVGEVELMLAMRNQREARSVPKASR